MKYPFSTCGLIATSSLKLFQSASSKHLCNPHVIGCRPPRVAPDVEHRTAHDEVGSRGAIPLAEDHVVLRQVVQGDALIRLKIPRASLRSKIKGTKTWQDQNLTNSGLGKSDQKFFKLLQKPWRTLQKKKTFSRACVLESPSTPQAETVETALHRLRVAKVWSVVASCKPGGRAADEQLRLPGGVSSCVANHGLFEHVLVDAPF